MATQGVFTVVQGGQVALKIITGQDGYNMPELAGEIRKRMREKGEVPSPAEAYDIAIRVGFGNQRSLVTMGRRESFHKCEGRLPRLYRETFYRPEFNPRWKQGIADFTKVIEV